MKKEYEVVSEVRRSVVVSAQSKADALLLAENIFKKDKFYKKSSQEYYRPAVYEIRNPINSYKILSSEEYEKLLRLAAKIGNVYRKYDTGTCHNYDRTITLKANELNTICLIENMFWDDIKGLINHNQPNL
ncbi:MAG: hypothetical protein GY799_12180 [Desulfobulbaceae bacterium]|nr:hypothetical protein [Desulfobulbaceae bacterium]